MVHEAEIDQFTENLHPICEQILHRVEIDEVIPHYLNEGKCHCKLKPSELRSKNYWHNEANTSQKQ